MEKQYLNVIAEFKKDGSKRPLSITLDNGKKLSIDKVLSIKKRPSLKHGGIGDRYEVMILNKRYFLFLENDHWFIETI